MPTVVQLPAGKALTVRAAADAFLDSLGNPNTVRSYSTGVGKTAERIGEARPLASVLSWLGWCAEYGYGGPPVPAWAKRLSVPDAERPWPARRWPWTG